MGRPKLTQEQRRLKSRRKYATNYKAPFSGAHAESNIPPPAHVLEDAQFRNAIPDRLWGDPKPGQSALDKRRDNDKSIDG